MLNLKIENLDDIRDWYWSFLKQHLDRQIWQNGITYTQALDTFFSNYFGVNFERVIKATHAELINLKESYESGACQVLPEYIFTMKEFYAELANKSVGIGPYAIKDRISAFHLMDKFNAPFVCPYCNSVSIVNKPNIEMRCSELDHFFPKSYFPFLSLSFFNLVPICHTCNSHKKDNLFEASPFFANDISTLSKFDYKGDHVTGVSFSLLFESSNEMKSNSRFLDIEGFYQRSNTQMLKNILSKVDRNPIPELEEKCRLIGKPFNLENELMNLFSIKFDEDPYFRNVHSKFEYDILKKAYNF